MVDRDRTKYVIVIVVSAYKKVFLFLLFRLSDEYLMPSSSRRNKRNRNDRKNKKNKGKAKHIEAVYISFHVHFVNCDKYAKRATIYSKVIGKYHMIKTLRDN